MNKEHLDTPRIPEYIFKKEVRYKIMSKFFKRRSLHGDIATLFKELKMNSPISIMGIRKKVQMTVFKQELINLIDKGYIKKADDEYSITPLGEQYAQSQKGESSYYFE